MINIIKPQVWISSMQSIAYHQIADRCTLKRDEIQGRFHALDDIPTPSDDIPSLRLG